MKTMVIRLLGWMMIYPFNKETDKSKWKRKPQFNEGHTIFDYQLMFTLFVQVGLCVFIMMYLTVHREVHEYWKFVYLMERIFGK